MPERPAIILKHLNMFTILKLTASRLFSVTHMYVLGINIGAFSSHTFSNIPKGELRRINDSDVSSLLGILKNCSQDDAKELILRLHFYSQGFTNCFVYVIDGRVASMQWLIFPSENTLLKSHYHRKFALLSASQVLIENVYVMPKYRGRGLVQFMTAQLLQEAKEQGYKYALAYVKAQLINPLNELLSLGFKLHKYITDFKIMGIEWRSLKKSSALAR